MPVDSFGFPLKTFGRERLIVGAASVGFTESTYTPNADLGQPADWATGKLEGGQIRYTTDGSNPAAAEGTLVEPGQVITVEGNRDIRRIRFVRTGTVDGALETEFARRI